MNINSKCWYISLDSQLDYSVYSLLGHTLWKNHIHLIPLRKSIKDQLRSTTKP
jgi:hypothetical protein